MNSLLGGQPYNPAMMQMLGLDPAEMRKQALWQGLTQAGLGLLGMGPSRTPIGFGDYLAAGVKGGAEGAMAGKEQYLNDAYQTWEMGRAAKQDERQAKDDAWQNTERARQMEEWQKQDDMVKQREDFINRAIGSPTTAFPVQNLGAARQYQGFGDTEGAFNALMAKPNPGQGFTLSPGQVRYDEYGNPIVSAPDTGGVESWETITTNEGVFRINRRDPSQMVKVGERPDRNEGEGREFTQEKQLRTEYEKASKPYVDLRVNYQRIIASGQDNTGASDIAMVYSFMKMLDPTSVVREGEFATAQNAGGVPSQIVAAYNRALSGERLAPEVRQQFMQQATRQYQQQLSTYESVRNQYRGLAQQYGVNPERVTPDLTYGVQVQPESLGIPPEAARELLADPSPQAIEEFNAVFGQGAAEAILQGR